MIHFDLKQEIYIILKIISSYLTLFIPIIQMLIYYNLNLYAI